MNHDGSKQAKQAVLYRMVMEKHVCPYGIKSKWLLKREGFDVEDHHLTTREETDAFKEKHDVKTTPQTFIEGKRIGGHDDLRAFFGKSANQKNQTSYQPVVAVFAVAALCALALSWAMFENVMTFQTMEWFVALSMMMLAMLKLQDIHRFSTMFLNYDLLARRWVPYAFLYPFCEAGAAIGMMTGKGALFSAPIALFIGTVGTVSVVKAVWVDKRELRCACVGGGSHVPLGFVSLTENIAMIAMGIWMPLKLLVLQST